jgi:hypothetical protein
MHADIVVPYHDRGFFDRHPDGTVGLDTSVDGAATASTGDHARS